MPSNPALSTPLRSPCKHGHCFDTGNPLAERGTRLAMWLTLVMMVAESVGGWCYGSMALLADGWHMGSHAMALGLAAFAYAYAREHAADPRYAFGTWKVEPIMTPGRHWRGEIGIYYGEGWGPEKLGTKPLPGKDFTLRPIAAEPTDPKELRLQAQRMTGIEPLELL